jgi:TRAP-type C4-dicarboxylate transport system permease small subunit
MLRPTVRKLAMLSLWRLLSGLCALLSAVALTALVALPVIQIVMRGVFSRPVIGIEEATAYALICASFIGLPLVTARDELIRLREFVDLLPEGLRNALAKVMALASFAAFAWVGWAGWNSGLQNAGTRTVALNIPYWLFVAPLVFGMAIASYASFLILLGRVEPSPSDALAPQPTGPAPDGET